MRLCPEDLEEASELRERWKRIDARWRVPGGWVEESRSFRSWFGVLRAEAREAPG